MSLSRRLIWVLSLGAVAATGCGGETFSLSGDAGADSSAGSGGDAGSGGSSAGGSASGGSGSGGTPGSGGTGGAVGTGGAGGNPGYVPCGAARCELDEICCDANCGLCGPATRACPAITCVDAGPPEPCGETICAPGSQCCDPVCGVCAPAGAPCPAPGGCMPDAGPTKRCGRAVCGADDACCVGCSVCVDEPSTCFAIDCAPQCSPMEAAGEGGCEMVLGYRWSYSGCEPVSGCSCAGKDCPLLFESPKECLEAHALCPIALP